MIEKNDTLVIWQLTTHYKFFFRIFPLRVPFGPLTPNLKI